MKISTRYLALFSLPMLCAAQPVEFEYLGKAVETEGTHVWSSSPVIGREGKVHLYVA